MRPRFAILAMVARLQPVALWIVFHDWPSAIASFSARNP